MTTTSLPASLADYADETSANHRAQIRRMHERDFADHRIDEVHPDIWYCGRPGTGNLHFYVAFLPHAIVIYGDIGDMLIRPGWNRGPAWLRGATHDGEADSLGYLFRKVPMARKRQVFMPGDVIADLLEDDSKEAKTALENWAEAIDCGGDPEASWYECASHAGLDCDWFRAFHDYEAEMYWCGLALCWFVRTWKAKHEG